MLIVTGLTRQNIYLRRSNTFILDLQYRNKANNAVINTTNYQGFLQIRPYENSLTMFFEANVTNQMVSFSGPDGGIHIEIDYQTTLNLPQFGRGVYEFLIIDVNNRAHSLLTGLAEIESSAAFIGKPALGTIGGANPDYDVQAAQYDWTQVKNKPTFSEVAYTGRYKDLIDVPAFNGSFQSLTGVPVFAKVATSGAYTDLVNVPAQFSPLPHTHSWDSITGKPNPLVFSGTWNSGVLYVINNIVLRNGSSYIAISSNSNVDPAINYPNGSPLYWQLLAQAGAAGSGSGGSTPTGTTDGGDF